MKIATNLAGSRQKSGFSVFSRFYSQQHPDTAESENQVGKPSGDEGRQPVDAAELVEELKGRPVEDSDSEAHSNPLERASFACRERKRHADDGHDKRHQRKGQLSIEVDHQRADVKLAPLLDP